MLVEVQVARELGDERSVDGRPCGKTKDVQGLQGAELDGILSLLVHRPRQWSCTPADGGQLQKLEVMVKQDGGAMRSTRLTVAFSTRSATNGWQRKPAVPSDRREFPPTAKSVALSGRKEKPETYRHAAKWRRPRGAPDPHVGATAQNWSVSH